MDLEAKPNKSEAVYYAYVVEAAEGYVGAKTCYTRTLLKSTLQLMGCKTRVAHKAAKAVFLELGKVYQANVNQQDSFSTNSGGRSVSLSHIELSQQVLSAVRSLTDKPVSKLDLQIACSIREQRQCVIILMAGTSGTGKSTLASLLAAKMGITTVVSTDSIRHMLRSFTTEADDPVLWASTYQAGDVIPLPTSPNLGTPTAQDSRKRAIQGYKAQSEPVIERLVRLVAKCEARNDSLLVEGVHLSMNAAIRIMARHPSVVPFLVYISNENKHRERFAVRAKYMTLDPGANRYVKHFRQIRVIQEYLVRRADRHCIPVVDNTNVDRSVAAIHATVLSCLRRRHRGEDILDQASKTTMPLSEDYEQCKRDTWSSKSMLQFIRSRKSGPEAVGASLASTADPGLPEVGLIPLVAAPSPAQPLHLEMQREAAPRVSSDAAPSKAGDASSGDLEGGSVAEQRVEGGSVAETELEEQEDDEHSEAVSVTTSKADTRKVLALPPT